MKELQGYKKSTAKPYKSYNVFAHGLYGPTFIANTSAKSKAQAINNVRYKYYGNERGVYNSDFFAKEIHKDTSSFKWYVIEYCVMDGNDPYFYQPYAHYDVRCAPSQKEAEDELFDENFFYGNGSERMYRQAYFGRISEFETKSEAMACALKWKKENNPDSISTASLVQNDSSDDDYDI